MTTVLLEDHGALSSLLAGPRALTEGHNFYFRGSWGMLRDSDPQPPKSTLLPKESGMSRLPDDTPWAVTEFAEAELGDARRTKRVVELATALAQHPTASLPEACGTGAMLKAAYRFFSNDAIEPQDLLQSHVEATYSRLEQCPLVLAVQDTTEVDWTSHRTTKGLGPLGHTACQGLHVHSTLALTPERVPLGLLAQQVWARDRHDVGKRARRKQLPITTRKARNGSAVLQPCAGRKRNVQRHALTVLAIGKRMSTTCWPRSVLRASSC